MVDAIVKRCIIMVHQNSLSLIGIAVVLTVLTVLLLHLRFRNNSTKLTVYTFLSWDYGVYLVYNTLINRKYIEAPWKKVYSGWLVEHPGQYTWNIDPIINLVMFIPLPILLNLLLGDRKNADANVRYIIIGIIVLSLFIELCQGIFHRGTFQVSDIFYNSLGGIISEMFCMKWISTRNKKT